MKICISATVPNLDNEIEPRFGRCPYFIIIDPDTMEFETLSNTSASQAGGAGIASAQSIVKKGVNIVITGNCGPNAYQVLDSSGIKVITGVSGKIRDIVESYTAGKFNPGNQANVPDHYGMGAGSGRGMGLGMGRGQGMGRKQGMGMGGGMQMNPPASSDNLNRDQEMKILKEQAETISRQLNEVQHRIEELGNQKS